MLILYSCTWILFCCILKDPNERRRKAKLAKLRSELTDVERAHRSLPLSEVSSPTVPVTEEDPAGGCCACNCSFECTDFRIKVPDAILNKFGFNGQLFLWAYRTAIFLTLGYLDVYALGDSIRVWSRFGSWVGLSVVSYFLLAMYMSTIGLIVLTLEPGIRWSERLKTLARLLNVLMEIATSNAVFVTLVQFIYFSSNTSRQNIALHLLPSVFILFDFFQHKMIFRVRHYPVCLSFPFAYLIFQWIRVYMGTMDWQYAFLYTSARSCFAAYIGLFATHFVIYGAIISLNYAKRRFYYYRHKVSHIFDDDDDDDSEDSYYSSALSMFTPRSLYSPRSVHENTASSHAIRDLLDEEPKITLSAPPQFPVQQQPPSPAPAPRPAEQVHPVNNAWWDFFIGASAPAPPPTAVHQHLSPRQLNRAESNFSVGGSEIEDFDIGDIPLGIRSQQREAATTTAPLPGSSARKGKTDKKKDDEDDDDWDGPRKVTVSNTFCYFFV